MTNPTPLKKLTKAKADELRALVIDFNEKKEARVAAATAEAEVHGLIYAITKAYALPIVDGVSQYFNVDELGKALRATRPEKALTVEPETFLALVGDENFHKVCKITKVDFNLERWNLMVEDEAVTNEMLLKSVPPEDPDKPETISLSLSAVRKGGK